MAGGGWGFRSALALAVALAFAPGPAPAQQPASVPFLIINQERLLTDSQSGQGILADEERQRDTLRNEARALDASFEAEERRLTEERPRLSAEEFRKLSDAFDARVVEARRQQDERANALALEFDQRRRAFYARVAPILVMLMDRYQAKAIFDETSVLIADQSVNITAAAITEIDAHAAEPAPTPGAGAPPASPDAGAAPEPPPEKPDGGE